MNVWKLIWPVSLSNLMLSMVGLIAIRVISPLGFSSVSAFTIGERIFVIQIIVITALSTATTARVSRAWGEKNYSEAKKLAVTSIIFGNVLAIVAMFFGILYGEKLVSILGLNMEATKIAGEYVKWLSIFCIPFINVVLINTSIRATGNTKTPFFIDAIMFLTTLLLMLLFVINENYHQVGIIHIALAKGLSWVIGLVCVVYYLFRKSVTISGVFKQGLLWIRVKNLYGTGYPVVLEQFMVQLGAWSFYGVITIYGTQAYAAWGIGIYAFSISLVIGNGVSLAGSILVGQALGEKNVKNAHQVFLKIVKVTMIWMSILSIIAITFSNSIANFFVDDQDVVGYAKFFIVVLGIVQPLIAIEFSIAGCLRGAGDTKFLFISSLVGLIVGRLLLSIYFLLIEAPVEWMYLTVVSESVLKVILLVLRYRTGLWIHAIKDEAMTVNGRSPS